MTISRKAWEHVRTVANLNNPEQAVLRAADKALIEVIQIQIAICQSLIAKIPNEIKAEKEFFLNHIDTLKLKLKNNHKTEFDPGSKDFRKIKDDVEKRLHSSPEARTKLFKEASYPASLINKANHDVPIKQTLEQKLDRQSERHIEIDKKHREKLK